MSINSNTSTLESQSVLAVRESPGFCHTRQAASRDFLYNADLMEELVEERFDYQENRRVEEAKRGKMTRRLSRGYSERWN